MQFSTTGKILKDAVKLLSKFSSGVSINGDYVRIIDEPGLTMLNMTVSSTVNSLADIDCSRASINIKINDNDNTDGSEYSDTAYIKFSDLKMIANLASKREYLVFHFYDKDKHIAKVQVGEGVVTIPYKENISTYNDLNATANSKKDKFVNLAGYNFVDIESLASKLSWGCTVTPSNHELLKNVLIRVNNKELTFIATNGYVVNRKKYTSNDNNTKTFNKELKETYTFAIDGKFFKQLSTIINLEQNLEIDANTKQLVYQAENIFITFDSADTEKYDIYNFGSIVDGNLSNMKNKATFTKLSVESLMTAINSAIKVNDKQSGNTIIMRFNQPDSEIHIESLKDNESGLTKYQLSEQVQMDFADKDAKEVTFAINGSYVLNALKALYNADDRDDIIDEPNEYTIEFSNDNLRPIAITDSADNTSHVYSKEEFVELITPVLLPSMRKESHE